MSKLPVAAFRGVTGSGFSGQWRIQDLFIGSYIFIEGGPPGGMEYLLRERGLPFPGMLLKYRCKMESFKAI